MAAACTVGLGLSLPIIIDDMANTADRLYHGWPERLYVLSPDGRIIYQGGKGPYGFNPEELAGVLKDLMESLSHA